MFLKQIFAREAELRGQIFVLRTSNFQGATTRPIGPRHSIVRNTLLSLLFTTKFSSARQNHSELFSTFLDVSR